MGKDDNGGLLSKVVRFVRNTTSWSDLDQPAKEQDSAHDRQQLKELVERKKANDFVRRREFDMLRKVRLQNAGGDPNAPVVHASQFQSSYLSKPAERELTIKKIDEIEAQMSMQWWKTKPRDAAQAAYVAGGMPGAAPAPGAAGMPGSFGAGGALAGGPASQAQSPASQPTPASPSLSVASRVVPPRTSGAPLAVAGQPSAASVPPRSAPPTPAPPARPMLDPMSWSQVPSPAPAARPASPGGSQPPVAQRPGAPVAPSAPAAARPAAVPPVRPAAPQAAAPEQRRSMPPASPPASPLPAASAPVRPPPAAAKPVTAPAKPAAPVAPPAPAAPSMIDFDPMLAPFTPAAPLAIEVGEIAHDPELEEAAIRFANGDDAGAEAGLKEALSLTGGRIEHVDTWLALFDLYRATGQQVRFDAAALDFANRFQRSAPQWFSMPDMVRELVAAKPVSPSASTSQAAHWVAPPLLTVKSLTSLRDILGRVPPPWRLDVARVTAIEPVALPMLAQLLGDWAGRVIEIQLSGADELDQLLAREAPSGEPTVAPDCWHARMALLRVLGRIDEFELTALNYCVTYEVSPPSWETPRCTCKTSAGVDEEPAGPVTIIGDPGELLNKQPQPASASYDFGATNLGMDSLLLPPVTVDLSGEIAGDVSGTLMKLEERFVGADTLTIACNKLVRVDFAAAGTLLNWVSGLHTDGRQVHFKNVHRLIAGFFSVIGISDLSRVTIRVD